MVSLDIARQQGASSALYFAHFFLCLALPARRSEHPFSLQSVHFQDEIKLARLM